MRVVITYLHRGHGQYLPLIDMAFASASRLGYETVMVGNQDLGDLHIPFGPDKEPRLMNWVLAAQLAYIESDLFNQPSVLFSPDALITKPLQPVFDLDFDIAFTDRKNSRWPINNGVIFLKPEEKDGIAKFWAEALSVCKGYDEETQNWFGDQQAVHDVYINGTHKQLGVDAVLLPCAEYNASPRDAEVADPEFMESAYIIHMKGKRKSLMQGYWDILCKKPSSR